MRCLVTGGNGFLGSHLVDILLKKNHNVTIFDKKKFHKKNKKLKIIYGDLNNSKLLRRAVKNQDMIFHFGGMSGINESLKQPLASAEINIISTIKLLDLATKFKIKRFIYASSVYVNSEQGGFYKTSKKATEDYIEEYKKRFNLNYTILRFGTIYGIRASRENSVNNIIKHAIKTKRVIYPANKKNLREYINVIDAAKATVEVIKNKYKNKYLIISGKQKIPVVVLMRTIKKLMKIKTKILYKNDKIAGHYISKPNTFKPRAGKRLKLNKYISLTEGILSILKEKNF